MARSRVRSIDPPASPPPSRAELLAFLAGLLGRLASPHDNLAAHRERIQRSPVWSVVPSSRRKAP